MTHSFTLILAGLTDLSDEDAERVFAAGCDDCTPSVYARTVCLEFDREREPPEEAIGSAIRDVVSAGFAVARIEPDDMVTQAEIARRLERSREYVRLLASGQRGSGGFPRPIAAVTSTSPLWSWAEVADWAADNRLLDPNQAAWANLVKNTNTQLHIVGGGSAWSLYGNVLAFTSGEIAPAPTLSPGNTVCKCSAQNIVPLFGAVRTGHRRSADEPSMAFGS